MLGAEVGNRMHWRITIILVSLLLWSSQGFGSLVTPSDRMTKDTLISYADASMYEDKRSGE